MEWGGQLELQIAAYLYKTVVNVYTIEKGIEPAIVFAC
jgi:hypothetical protein